jgi:hypothetical protein
VTWSITAIQENFGMDLARAPTANAKPTPRLTMPATPARDVGSISSKRNCETWSELLPRVSQDASARGLAAHLLYGKEKVYGSIP